MKIISHRTMPKKYFDICEARRCPREAKHLIIIQSESDGRSEAQEYALCEKHLAQFISEASRLLTPQSSKGAEDVK